MSRRELIRMDVELVVFMEWAGNTLLVACSLFLSFQSMGVGTAGERNEVTRRTSVGRPTTQGKGAGGVCTSLVGAWMSLLPADWCLLGRLGLRDSLPSIKAFA